MQKYFNVETTMYTWKNSFAS